MEQLASYYLNNGEEKINNKKSWSDQRISSRNLANVDSSIPQLVEPYFISFFRDTESLCGFSNAVGFASMIHDFGISLQQVLTCLPGALTQDIEQRIEAGISRVALRNSRIANIAGFYTSNPGKPFCLSSWKQSRGLGCTAAGLAQSVRAELIEIAGQDKWM